MRLFDECFFRLAFSEQLRSDAGAHAFAYAPLLPLPPYFAFFAPLRV